MITTELSYLTWTTIITALMWMPYVLNLIPKPLAPWAARMKQAHANAIENLVVFATLVLVAHIAGVNNEVTAIACAVYFWARVVHFVVLGFGIPWIRTLSFVTGFGCQLALAWQILM